MTREIHHFIDGKTFKGSSGQFGDVFNPNTGEVQARVQFATPGEVAKAVETAKAAQIEWAAMNPQRRARVLMTYKSLVEAEMDELAHLLSSEHGKVIADAKGDLIRGLETGEPTAGNVDVAHLGTEICLAVAESHIHEGGRVPLPLANRTLCVPNH